MKIKVKRLSPNATVPTKAYAGDACFDLTAAAVDDFSRDGITTQVLVGFGIALEIPEGYTGRVFARGSIYGKKLRLSNAVGVIDSGYRGELQAVFDTRPGLDTDIYKKGERCAQIMFVKLPEVEFEEVDELSPSERGGGGFGSSGTKGGPND